jgi:hypothetical protein
MEENVDDIEKVVRAVLFDLTDIPISRIHLTDSLIGDLNLNGDDFSLIFVPQVGRQLNIMTKPGDWDSSRTVSDLIGVLRRCRLAARQ